MVTQKKRWPAIVLIVLVFLIIVGGGIFYYYKMSQKTVSPTTSPSVETSNSVAPTNDGVTWIKPQVLGDLSLIKTGDTGIASAKYYKIGTLADGSELILASLSFDGPGMPILYRFKKSADGKYSYILKNSSEKDTGVLKLSLADVVTMDSNLSFASITAPNKLTLKNTP